MFKMIKIPMIFALMVVSSANTYTTSTSDLIQQNKHLFSFFTSEEEVSAILKAINNTVTELNLDRLEIKKKLKAVCTEKISYWQRKADIQKEFDFFWQPAKILFAIGILSMCGIYKISEKKRENGEKQESLVSMLASLGIGIGKYDTSQYKGGTKYITHHHVFYVPPSILQQKRDWVNERQEEYRHILNRSNNLQRFIDFFGGSAVLCFGGSLIFLKDGFLLLLAQHQYKKYGVINEKIDELIL